MKNFDLRLKEFIKEDTLIAEAMNYSLLSGGKRVRKNLYLLFSKLFKDVDELDIDFAIAIEMIHTYSLVHDDLPCMDNDDLRRGKKTNHIVYGQAQATLAGDGLLNLAYEILFKLIKKDLSFIEPSLYLANSAGYKGMIYGQSLDILSENKKVANDIIEKIIINKTSKLIQAPIVCAMKRSKIEREYIYNLGRNIGVIFQIKDDLLDVLADESKLGKTVGKDKELNKNTFVNYYGINKSKEKISDLYKDIKDDLVRLEEFGDIGEIRELISFIIERDY